MGPRYRRLTARGVAQQLSLMSAPEKGDTACKKRMSLARLTAGMVCDRTVSINIVRFFSMESLESEQDGLNGIMGLFMKHMLSDIVKFCCKGDATSGKFLVDDAVAIAVQLFDPLSKMEDIRQTVCLCLGGLVLPYLKQLDVDSIPNRISEIEWRSRVDRIVESISNNLSKKV
eukprot:Selendium_serpulae@DN5192_c0_g1_i2.p1